VGWRVHSNSLTNESWSSGRGEEKNSQPPLGIEPRSSDFRWKLTRTTHRFENTRWRSRNASMSHTNVASIMQPILHSCVVKCCRDEIHRTWTAVISGVQWWRYPSCGRSCWHNCVFRGIENPPLAHENGDVETHLIVNQYLFIPKGNDKPYVYSLRKWPWVVITFRYVSGIPRQYWRLLHFITTWNENVSFRFEWRLSVTISIVA